MTDQEKDIKKGLSRRDFIKTAALATGAGFLAGCQPKAPAVEENAVVPAEAAAPAAEGAAAACDCTPSFMVPPAPIEDSEISDTIEVDIVIVGCGVSGLSAARAASEQGASVAVIEKAESYQYRSGQYGVNGSEYHKSLGMTFDANSAVSDLMKEMGYRPDQRIWNIWRDYSGEAWDWLIKPAMDKDLIDYIDYTAMEYNPERITISSLHYPYPEAFVTANEYSPTYPEATLTFLPDQGGILKMSYDICIENGVDFHFSTWAKQLIRPNQEGRVQGVIAQDIDGNYIKLTANKGVIMAAGDYGSNEEMVKHYCGGRTWRKLFPNVDANGNATNMGEGQQMGLWAGAKIEDGPHAPMTHTLGSALGCDPFLMINTDGARFCNEDVAGQQLSSQIFRQKDGHAWYIFDDNYPDQVEYMPVGHGAVNYVLPESENPHLEANMAIGKPGTTSREEVEERCMVADTLEELLTMLEMSEEAQKTALESIARYNELCADGYDADFNKTPGRMFPIETGPFYAAQVSGGSMLVCLGGLSVDPVTMKCVDDNFATIEGLYAVGNNMGGRILQDYPVTVAGVSHGTALTFGYYVGKIVANS